MKEYDETRSVLVTMLEELNNRLDTIIHDVRHEQTPLEKDFAEQATQNENNEVILMIAAKINKPTNIIGNSNISVLIRPVL